MDKYLLPVIPSSAMIISSMYINLADDINNLILAFATGVLLISSYSLYGELKSSKDLKKGIIGFILSLMSINLIEYLFSNSSVLSALYFDSFSDGALLGILINSVKKMKTLYLVIISMTIEMFITAYSTKSILGEENKTKVALAGVILLSSSIIGHYFYKLISEPIMIGLSE